MGIATIIPRSYVSDCKIWRIVYQENEDQDFLTLDEILADLIDTDF